MNGTYSGMLASMAGIARQLVSRVNPATGESVISNWPTQLLGNRPMTGSLTFKVNDRSKTHHIDNFMPARESNGKPSKSRVGDFRRNYEAGLPEKVASKEWLNVLTYFVLSIMTGRMPTPTLKGFSGESTLKSVIAASWVDASGIEITEATVKSPDGTAELTHSAEAITGLFRVFEENRQRTEAWPVKESSRSKGEAIDWSELA